MGDWVFGLREGETWWSTSDIGWVVGHSYIVYAPLMAGATTLAYEGSIDHPDANTVWSIIEHERVTGIFTSPTGNPAPDAVRRGIPRRHDLGSLERLFSAGEVLNAPAWEWLQRTVFEDRIPVMDHMWQTETAGPIFGLPYGYAMLPIKPGSAGVALPGIEADIVDQDGNPLGVNEKGVVRIKRPFPGLIPTLWGEPERYVDDYWRKIPGGYYVGDAAHIDEDGYAWFAGRADEIIKISDHRMGTIEVETAFLRHPAVAEAGVSVPDELRGAVIEAFVALRAGHEPSDELRQELLQTVRRELGPIAVIKHVSFVAMLPKTRSGKIMRRVLKAVALDLDPGDISTIEDEGSVEEARRALEEFKAGSRCDGGRGRPVDAVLFDLFGTLPSPSRSTTCARTSHPVGAPNWRCAGGLGSSSFVASDRDAAVGRLRPGHRGRARKRAPRDGRKCRAGGRGPNRGAFRDLPVRPEVPGALEALRDGGLRTGILTNASAATLDSVLRRTGLTVDHALSVDAARRFKPDPAVYELGTKATGLPAERIGFVTGNAWDAAGAGTYGFRVAAAAARVSGRPSPVGAPEPIEATWADLPWIFVGA